MSLLAFGAAEASAAGVTVIPSDGPAVSYEIGGLAGSFDVATPVAGISVNKLLTLAKADGPYAYVEVSAGGRTVRLTRAQLESTASAVPVIYETGGQAAFAAGADQLIGGSITVAQFAGPKATGTASKKSAKVRQSVTFKGSVKSAAAGQKFIYSWRFSDGTTAKGETVKHAFKKTGRHTALLTVTVVGEDTTLDGGVVVVQIGKRVESKQNREGGGTNENAAAPTSGAANGDSGAGDQAATDSARKTTKRKKKTEQPDTGGLESVTGELLASSSPIETPVQSTLAARSGQQVVQNPKSFGMSGEQLAATAAVLLLLGGVLMEFGVPQALHRRIHNL